MFPNDIGPCDGWNLLWDSENPDRTEMEAIEKMLPPDI